MQKQLVWRQEYVKCDLRVLKRGLWVKNIISKKKLCLLGQNWSNIFGDQILLSKKWLPLDCTQKKNTALRYMQNDEKSRVRW